MAEHANTRESVEPGTTRAGRAQGVLLDAIHAAAAARVDWIQIREKDLSGRDYSLLVRDALQVTRSAEATANGPADRAVTRVVVNDRLDVALAEGAGGVHLGANSLPPHDVQRWLRSRAEEVRDFLVGVSCHSVQEAEAAEGSGADYIFFGPVYATPSKASYGTPQGVERLAEVCREVSIPVLAIGGIDTGNASACFAAGAAGIAAIRLFQDSGNVAALVHALRKSFAAAR
ncbi:MAG: hypothetical protein NVS9B4_21470 [Candidatus Acidiferrum sp.]